MLLPALNRARDVAKKISCTSNLKQFGAAFANYAGAYGDMVPPQRNDFSLYTGESSWEAELALFMDIKVKLYGISYLKVFSCSAGVNQYTTTGIITNYGYNQFMGSIGPSAWQWPKNSIMSNKKLSRFKQPTMALVAADTLNNSSIISPYGAAPTGYPRIEVTYLSTSPAQCNIDMFRHPSNNANILFVDRHVAGADTRKLDRDQVALTTDKY
jgi:prepilin-type processing-associated H-X9-DG protein